MKSSEVYRKAARSVKAGRSHGCCWAIVNAAYPNDGCHTLGHYRKECPQLQRFIALFPPDDGAAVGYWFCGDKEHRLNALLLLAAISESEGD